MHFRDGVEDLEYWGVYNTPDLTYFRYISIFFHHTQQFSKKYFHLTKLYKSFAKKYKMKKYFYIGPTAWRALTKVFQQIKVQKMLVFKKWKTKILVCHFQCSTHINWAFSSELSSDPKSKTQSAELNRG